MSLRSVLARGFGAVVAVAVVAAALVGVLAHGAALEPRLDLLSHFAPLYMVVALAGLLIGIVVRVPWRGAILTGAAVGVIASGLLIAPEFTRANGSAVAFDREGQVKVIQINALRTNADIRRVVDWLVAQDPDVVTISEARHDLRDLLVQRTGWATAGAHGSLMIFTREPYVRMNRPQVPAGSTASFVNATYETRAGLVEIVTVHLDWPTQPDAAAQVRDLERVVGRLPRERMILTGDFNATPWSAELRRLDETLGLVRRDRAVASWPAQFGGRTATVPVLPIDHVYAGRGWATVKVERGPWLGSDHYPVIVTLAPVVKP